VVFPRVFWGGGGGGFFSFLLGFFFFLFGGGVFPFLCWGFFWGVVVVSGVSLKTFFYASLSEIILSSVQWFLLFPFLPSIVNWVR